MAQPFRKKKCLAVSSNKPYFPYEPEIPLPAMTQAQGEMKTCAPQKRLGRECLHIFITGGRINTLRWIPKWNTVLE